jgi:DNA-binding NtrC family response regulator
VIDLPRLEREERSRVLVIDDDPAITRVVRRALASHFWVTESNDPSEALEGIAAGNRYEVILCDVSMPGLCGADFHREVEGMSPELAKRILFMTGTTSAAPGAAFLRDFPERRIMKPFHLVQLRSTVADSVKQLGRWGRKPSLPASSDHRF